jgi:hypothetical protein
MVYRPGFDRDVLSSLRTRKTDPVTRSLKRMTDRFLPFSPDRVISVSIGAPGCAPAIS